MESGRWRRWAILFGAVILFVVVFDQLERLAGPGKQPAGEGGAAPPEMTLEPIRPELIRRGTGGVRVELEGGYGLTLNLDDAAEADRVFACLEEGIATSPALTEGEAGQPPTANTIFARRARAEQVWNEVIRIHNGCSPGP